MNSKGSITKHLSYTVTGNLVDNYSRLNFNELVVFFLSFCVSKIIVL